MKDLNVYIFEKRGIVTDENSWSNLVDNIIDYVLDKAKNQKYLTIPHKYLTPWLSELNVEILDYKDYSYVPKESEIMDNKLSAYLEIYVPKENVDKKALKHALEHEISHAFDDYIARTKRGEKINTDYPATGFALPETDERDMLDLDKNPKKVSSTHLFYLLDKCGYYFSNTEVSAYLREFDLVLKEYENKQYNFKSIYNDINDGAGPIVWLDLLHICINNINKYKVDQDHIDWEYMNKGINLHWSKEFLGKTVSVKTKEDFIRVINIILKRYGDKIIKRYNRLFTDHNVEIKNKPYWF